jgi:hypothetical protein
VPDAFRPDRCGVLFALNENLLSEGCAVYAYEMQPGAADRPAVARWMREVAARAPVLLVRADGRREVLTADPALGARATGKRA